MRRIRFRRVRQWALVALLMMLAASGAHTDSFALTVTEREATAVAVEELLPLAEGGDADAQVMLGNKFHHGWGVSEDPEEAVMWYRLAAEQGNADGQFGLGVMSWNGEGLPQDEAAAIAWFSSAADQGHAAAQTRLANMYLNGNGVTQNTDTALQYFSLAADQGYRLALLDLGRLYLDGEKVPRDFYAAFVFFDLAITIAEARGDVGAQFLANSGRAQAGAKLTSGQIADARADIDQWLREHPELGVEPRVD